MTDENPEGEGPADETPDGEPVSIPFVPFPFADPAQMQEMQDRRQMQSVANAHEVRDFFQRLSQHDKAILHNLLHNIGVQGGRKMAVHYSGLVAGLLVSGGYCDFCDEDHGADLQKMVEGGGDAGPSSDD